MGTPKLLDETEHDQADGGDDVVEAVLRRGARIRENEVARIADQLLLEGHRPSVDRIRTKLQRGSPNTIALFLDRWWSRLGARLRDLPGHEYPQLPESVNVAVMALWNEAIDHARTLLHDSLSAQVLEVTTERVQLAERTADIERQRDELRRERETLQHTVNLAHSQLGEANDRQRADALRMTELQSEVARITGQFEGVRTDRDSLASKLEAALQQHRDDVRTLTDRNDATERHWMKEVDDARQQLVAARKQAHALEQHYNADSAAKTQELREARMQIVTLTSELTHVHESLQDAKAHITQLERGANEQAIRMDRIVHALQESQTQSTRQVESLQLQLREAHSKIKETTVKLETMQRNGNSKVFKP